MACCLRPVYLPDSDMAEFWLADFGAAGEAGFTSDTHGLLHFSAVPEGAAEVLADLAGSLEAKLFVGSGRQSGSLLLAANADQRARLSLSLGQRLETEEIATALNRLASGLRQPPGWLRGRTTRMQLDRPRIMGILNLTPDSFYDGGRYTEKQQALDRARELVDAGADIIDVGGESSRPGSLPVSPAEELDRVVPVVEQLAAEFPVPISVDTTKSAVAEASLAVGAEFINDISGLTFEPALGEVVARYGAGLFLMHTRGRPEVMQQQTGYPDLLAEVYGSLQRSLELARSCGIAEQNLAVDPGIGFGKDVRGNLEILQRLSELQGLGVPLLLGTSRKSFIGKVLGQPDPSDRLAGTLATVALGVAAGAMLHRVHDVAPARQAAALAWAIKKGGQSLD